jgi:hypothetical protein
MDSKQLFYLTGTESEKIKAWIVANDYTLTRGYFELGFAFSAYGNYIEFTYSQDGNKYLLEVNNDSLLDDPLRTVNHIVTDTRHVQLDLSANALDTYFLLNREITEAHVNADCEPPGAKLSFEIYQDRCNILTGHRQRIETR